MFSFLGSKHTILESGPVVSSVQSPGSEKILLHDHFSIWFFSLKKKTLWHALLQSMSGKLLVRDKLVLPGLESLPGVSFQGLCEPRKGERKGQ